MKTKKQTKKAKRKETVFEGIMQGALEALAFAKGTADLSQYKIHVPEELDVKAIRKATGLTQQAFAMRFGFNLARLRDLEQKRTQPDSAIRAYLTVIRKDPEAVKKALAA
jgi:putative transcriptional regulator